MGPDLDVALAEARAQPGCPEEKRLRIAIMSEDPADLSFDPREFL